MFGGIAGLIAALLFFSLPCLLSGSVRVGLRWLAWYRYFLASIFFGTIGMVVLTDMYPDFKELIVMAYMCLSIGAIVSVYDLMDAIDGMDSALVIDRERTRVW